MDTAPSHCMHGAGHAAMLIAVRDASNEARNFFKAGPCGYRPELGVSHDPEISLIISPQMLRAAIDICKAAPSIEMRYMCGSGMYMTYWTESFTGWIGHDFDFVATCAGMPWPATCYRWTFRYASARQVRKLRSDPCPAGLMNIKDLKGCIWGMVTQWFLPVYSGPSSASSLYPALADFCLRLLNSTSDENVWLTCVTAGMEAAAYDDHPALGASRTLCTLMSSALVGNASIKWPQLTDRTNELCIITLTEPYNRMTYRAYLEKTSALLPSPCSRKIDLCIHGWRVDVLEK